MKKIFLLLLLSVGIFQANAQQSACSYQYTTSGNTAYFNHAWIILGTQTIDSVRFNYGDATTQLFASPIPANSPHTYPGPGTYQTCLTRYISSLNQPGVIACTFCDSVTVGSTTSNCFVNAGFTPTISGQVVNFINTTACANCTSLTYTWNFGDGSPFSNSTNPIHTYAPGTFTACLYAMGVNAQNQTCIDSICTTFTISQQNSCIATLSSSIAGNAVAFTASATGGTPPYTYTFNFNDGSPTVTNTTGTTTHNYLNGNYTPCVTITAGNTACTACDTITVGTTIGCVANASYTSNVIGQTANFNNTSTCTGCTASSFMWDFGDMSPPSTQANPTHTYLNPGPYTVCLYMTGIDAQNNICMDTVCQVLAVGNAPSNCVIAASFSESITGLNVNFADNSSVTAGIILNRNWSYGDGGTGTGSNPTHTYTSPGTYQVYLIVTGMDTLQNPCIDSASKMITVGPNAVKNIETQKLSIYPNPTADNFIIELPANETIEKLEITDAAGRKILGKIDDSKRNTLTVSLARQADGIYFIKLQTNRQLYTASLLKQE